MKPKKTEAILKDMFNREDLRYTINEIKEDPMADNEISSYLPNAKILSYNELKNVNSIDNLLKNDKDYFFLLYLAEPNSGHWCAVSKNKDKIEFFDPYGLKLDNELSWIPKDQNNELGVQAPYLSHLLGKSKYKVTFNNIPYQKLGNDINCCGRHCVFRIINFLKNNMNNEEYYKFMKGMKDKFKLNYDDIVSFMISK